MRRLILSVPFLMLAACGGAAEGDKAADSATADAAPDAAAVPAAAGATLPTWLVGKWALPDTSCADGSDSRVTITAGEIQFFEEVARVTKVEAGDAESVLVDVDAEAEGEVTKAQYSFAPSDAGAKMTMTNMADGNSNDYARCPA